MSAKSCCLLSLVVLFSYVSGQQDLNLNDCVNVGSQTLVTYPEWPFQLDCRKLFKSRHQSSQCFVSEEHMPPMPANTTFILNVTTTFLVSLVRNDASCRSKNVTVELRTISSLSSFDSISDDFTNNINVVQREKTFGDQFLLNCFPPSNKNDGLTFKLALPPKYKATWWRTQRYENGTLGNKTRFSSPMFRNYTQFIENSYLAQIITYPRSPQSIQKYSATFFDPAVYSCELQYGEESAFIVHQELCINDRQTDSPPAIDCILQHVFEEGENVEIDCRVYSSNMMIEAGELEVLWAKKEAAEPKCTYLYQSENGITATELRYNCSVNADENDAGEYSVEVKYKNKSSAPAIFTLHLQSQEKATNLNH